MLELLPNTQTHERHAQRQPPEEPHGDNALKTHRFEWFVVWVGGKILILLHGAGHPSKRLAYNSIEYEAKNMPYISSLSCR